MPWVPTPVLDEAVKGKAERKELRTLLQERAVLGYAFSYMKLYKLLARYMHKEEICAALEACISAYDDDGEKIVKKELNEKISVMYSELGLESLRFEDPFSRKLDCLNFMSRTAPQFSKQRAIEIAPKHHVSTEVMMKIIEEATTPGKEYASVQVRPVKEKEEKNGKG